MSYANEIGGLQQALSSIAPSTAKPSTAVGAPADQTKEGLTSTLIPARSDQTSLSSTGGIISRAMEGPDTRSAKVLALQQAIASGSYSVPASQVAEKMIQSLLG
jgi:flagellar biosynthesis anti-sigma factor FlgM